MPSADGAMNHTQCDSLLIGDRYDCEEEEVLRILKKVQRLDPLGIAALDLQNCLLIQARGADKND